MDQTPQPSSVWIKRWLEWVIIAVAIMVIIGGITRLTGSGLSMTDWRLVGGAVPPLTQADWEDKFALYQGSPQHRIIHTDMTIEEFKGIFWWEYIHRMWGRFLGLLFFIPFVFFWVKGQLDSRRVKLMWIAFLLGAAQGLLGWFMVQSGLVDRPWVSPVRLTAHLLLALFLLGFLTWNRIEMEEEGPKGKRLFPASLPRWMHWAVPLLLIGFVVQFSFGGVLAGLKGAMDYPSFPTMNGAWIPAGWWKPEMGWHNWVENSALVHLIHRSLGTFLLLATSVVAWMGWHRLNGCRLRVIFPLLAGVVWLQFILGIVTVLGSRGGIPVLPGVLHQSGAIFLSMVLAILFFWSCQREGREA